MKISRCDLGLLLLTLVFAPASRSQNSSVVPASASPGAPPFFLNIVRLEIQPGRTSTHHEQEAAIVRGYTEATIPVYWIEWDSVTGPSGALYLNLFDSFEQAGQAGAAMGAGLATNPELADRQEQLLRDNVTAMRTTFTLLRDDLGYGTVNFAKARLLRVTTVEVRPGHEGEFVEAARGIRIASEKAHADVAWAVYEVNAGLPSPAFVFLTPMQSWKEMDAAATRRSLYEDAKTDALQQRLREIVRSAYVTMESQIYSVGREQSHVSEEFAAVDPDFWRPAVSQSSEKTVSPNNTVAQKNR